MTFSTGIRAVAVVFFGLSLMLVSLSGCGGEADVPPKAAGDLTEQEKQQVRELQEQRASEWGTGKKK